MKTPITDLVRERGGGYLEAVELLELSRAELLAALEAATERMEAVSVGIPVHNRHPGVSQRAHVAHMAGHLEQHAKFARAAVLRAVAGGVARQPTNVVTVRGGVAEETVGETIIIDWDNINEGDEPPEFDPVTWAALPAVVREDIEKARANPAEPTCP